MNEQELRTKLNEEKQRLAQLNIVWDVADVMAIVCPVLKEMQAALCAAWLKIGVVHAELDTKLKEAGL